MGMRRSNGACPLLGGFGPRMKGNVQRSFWRLLRQRMKAFAFCLGVTGLTRLMIHQALAFRAFQQFVATLRVRHCAAVVPEIEFRQVAVQVGFANAVEVSVDAALYQGKVAFDGVRVPEVTAHVFLGAVVYGAMTGEFLADLRVDRAFVGHQVGLAAGRLDDDRAKCL